jgi:hypothetical protein
MKVVQYRRGRPLTVITDVTAQHDDPAQAEAFLRRVQPALLLLSNWIEGRMTDQGG